jgi:hypothetical protein
VQWTLRWRSCWTAPTSPWLGQRTYSSTRRWFCWTALTPLTRDGRTRRLYFSREAFARPAPREALRSEGTAAGPWKPGARGVLEALVEQADQLSQATHTPYWSQRRAPPLTVEEVMDKFVLLVAELHQRGYFEGLAPRDCNRPSGNPSGQLKIRVGVGRLWPLDRSQRRWDQDVFFDLVEVLHDFVARPRARSWHDDDDGGCHDWHHQEFAVEPGRRLYRWRVNRLLGRSTIAYRLAEEGDDVGRLVAITDDERDELASTMARRTGSGADQVRHALAQYRARGADQHNKRSAIIALAGLLEERREVIQEHLSRKDEGVLFEIANRFGLRHQRAGQLTDYDPVFLDWIFWWYLATVELTNRLTEREPSQA